MSVAFCLLFFVSLSAYAVDSGAPGAVSGQLLPNQSLPDPAFTEKQIISVKKLEPSIVNINPVMADLLKRFRKQPDDLQLIDDLNHNTNIILASIKQRLADKTQRVTIDETKELMLVLSVMRHEQALVRLIELAEYHQNNTETGQKALLLLRDLPVTEPVLSYVNRIFNTSRNNTPLVRSALLYYLSVKHKTGMRWAAYYRSPGIDPQLRFAGMVLAAILTRDDQVTRWILHELKTEPPVPAYQQYYLLQALQTSITEQEFNYLITQLKISPAVLKEFQRLLDFNKATGEQKHRLADFMLTSPHLEQQQKALEFFLLEQKILDIWPSLDANKRLSAIRLSNTLGLPIVSKKDAMTTETATPLLQLLSTSMFAHPVIVVLALFLLWSGYRYVSPGVGKSKVLKTSM